MNEGKFVGSAARAAQDAGNAGDSADTPSSPDIVAELDRWLTAGASDNSMVYRVLRLARDEIVKLRSMVVAQRSSIAELREERNAAIEALSREVSGTSKRYPGHE